MDSISHTQRLYARIDAEITAFIALLAEVAQDPGHLPDVQARAIQKLGEMMIPANEIGGQLLLDVQLLKLDFHRYQIQAESLQKIQQDALRIKHEVRVL